MGWPNTTRTRIRWVSLSLSLALSLCLNHLACIFSDFFFRSFLQTELLFFMLSERARARLQLWTFRRKRTKRKKKSKLSEAQRKNFFARLYGCVCLCESAPNNGRCSHTHSHTRRLPHTLSFSVQVVASTPQSSVTPLDGPPPLADDAASVQFHQDFFPCSTFRPASCLRCSSSYPHSSRFWRSLLLLLLLLRPESAIFSAAHETCIVFAAQWDEMRDLVTDF